MFNSIIDLFFPQLCLACGHPLNKFEKYICIHCYHKLPKTHYHLEKENKLTELFWGRAEIHSAAAYLYYQKLSKTQHLLHALKYQNQKNAGKLIGEIYGEDLIKSPYFSTIDYIIPIPLHPKKLHQRGYNQSQCFAEGLSISMGVPVRLDLIRKQYTQTQTKKSKYDRWINVADVFSLKQADIYCNKHILLVDDVITTGATMEACIQQFESIPDIRISIAGIAVATTI